MFRSKPVAAALLSVLLPAAFVLAGASPAAAGDAGDSNGPAGQASGADALAAAGADGLGTVVFAFFAITALAVACLIVGFRISRRESED
ncbi:hypothetical protein [Flindersiella endophytica]